MARYNHYVSKKKYKKSIELFNWEDDYAWNKSYPAFLMDLVQTSPQHWCRRCLRHLVNENSLEIHKRYCQRGHWADPYPARPFVQEFLQERTGGYLSLL